MEIGGVLGILSGIVLIMMSIMLGSSIMVVWELWSDGIHSCSIFGGMMRRSRGKE
ncbi:MAG: hypothetical protein KBA26_01550 [Candidatus Delongbacteria bacterium]|nr:hypothetical protein [Candidatus Delongbacteria bacterium]